MRHRPVDLDVPYDAGRT